MNVRSPEPPGLALCPSALPASIITVIAAVTIAAARLRAVLMPCLLVVGTIAIGLPKLLRPGEDPGFFDREHPGVRIQGRGDTQRDRRQVFAVSERQSV